MFYANMMFDCTVYIYKIEKRGSTSHEVIIIYYKHCKSKTTDQTPTETKTQPSYLMNSVNCKYVFSVCCTPGIRLTCFAYCTCRTATNLLLIVLRLVIISSTMSENSEKSTSQ